MDDIIIIIVCGILLIWATYLVYDGFKTKLYERPIFGTRTYLLRLFQYKYPKAYKVLILIIFVLTLSSVVYLLKKIYF